jgi:hypothetical protein
MRKLYLTNSMQDIWSRSLNENWSFIIFVTIALTFFVLSNFSNAYSQIYSKSDQPFGISPSDWIAKWWNWWIDVSIYENPGTNAEVANKCTIRSSDAMVMLMETTVKDAPVQECKISSEQGIMVPLWTSFQEDSINQKGIRPYSKLSNEQFANLTKALFDTGTVHSEVKVDGILVAKLDETTTRVSTDPNDTKNLGTTTTASSMQNVIEIWSKPFNITIPPYTYAPDQNIGTWRAGAHGWFTFLKPLEANKIHTIEYTTKVEGANGQDNTIKYNLMVE